MNMTRRAFIMHQVQPIGEDFENAGEWLLRKGCRGSIPLSGGGTVTANEPTLPMTVRGAGLRNARANMRRKDNGYQ